MLWLSAPVEWWVEDDEIAEFKRYEQPILRTSQDVYVESNTFRQH